MKHAPIEASEMTIFGRSLVSIISASREPEASRYESLSPPITSRIRQGSFYRGLWSTKIFETLIHNLISLGQFNGDGFTIMLTN